MNQRTDRVPGKTPKEIYFSDQVLEDLEELRDHVGGRRSALVDRIISDYLQHARVTVHGERRPDVYAPPELVFEVYPCFRHIYAVWVVVDEYRVAETISHDTLDTAIQYAKDCADEVGGQLYQDPTVTVTRGVTALVERSAS